jgi:hypothetical protein
MQAQAEKPTGPTEQDQNEAEQPLREMRRELLTTAAIVTAVLLLLLGIAWLALRQRNPRDETVVLAPSTPHFADRPATNVGTHTVSVNVDLELLNEHLAATSMHLHMHQRAKALSSLTKARADIARLMTANNDATLDQVALQDISSDLRNAYAQAERGELDDADTSVARLLVRLQFIGNLL